MKNTALGAIVTYGRVTFNWITGLGRPLYWLQSDTDTHTQTRSNSHMRWEEGPIPLFHTLPFGHLYRNIRIPFSFSLALPRLSHQSLPVTKGNEAGCLKETTYFIGAKWVKSHFSLRPGQLVSSNADAGEGKCIPIFTCDCWNGGKSNWTQREFTRAD